MYISDKLIFIELHKTASSHITKVLLETLNGKQIGKHNAATQTEFLLNLPFLGSIRNPWDWYLSLWRYGCDLKGGLYGYTTRSKLSVKGLGWKNHPCHAANILFHSILFKDSKLWRGCYSDVNNPECFKTWLTVINDSKYLLELPEFLAFSPTSSFLGLYTYRYLRLFCKNSYLIMNNVVRTYNQILEYEAENNYINFFIKTESLNNDLIEALELCNVNVDSSLKKKIFGFPKTNQSSKSIDLKNYHEYYEPSLCKLIQERDKLIINKFSYHFPMNTGH